jgi:penicillin-binding protein 1A
MPRRCDPDQHAHRGGAGAEYYVADWVESLMTSYLGDINEDVIVYTTIDWDLQKQAEFTVRRGSGRRSTVIARLLRRVRLLPWMSTARCAPWSAASITRQSQYNRAVTARRQPGSTFKPFVYRRRRWRRAIRRIPWPTDAQFDYQRLAARATPTGKLRRPRDAAPGRLRYSLNTIAGRCLPSTSAPNR